MTFQWSIRYFSEVEIENHIDIAIDEYISKQGSIDHRLIIKGKQLLYVLIAYNATLTNDVQTPETFYGHVACYPAAFSFWSTDVDRNNRGF